MRRRNLPSRGQADLSAEELLRFGRQIIVPGVGLRGQVRLKKARVLIVGAGGLGSPTALYLAAAGLGKIGIIDHDFVEASNLQRQILHFTSDIGRMKVESARRKLGDLNPFVKIDTFNEPLRAANALRIVGKYDVVVDGSDNFSTRYVINDACVLLKKPMVYASVQHVFGQVSVFDAQKGPCYRCLMPDPPRPGSVLGCAETGVLGMIPGLIGTLQAIEAVKIILRLGTPLIGRLLFYDAAAASFDLIHISKDPECRACGRKPSIVKPVDYEAVCKSDSPEFQPEAEPGMAAPVKALSVSGLKKRIKAGEKPIFLDIREPGEIDGGTFKEALAIPRSQIIGRIQDIPRDREVVVLCRVGIQSRAVIRELQDLGFENLLNLEGGTIAWEYDIDLGP